MPFRSHSLDLDSGWGIGEETFALLVGQMRLDGPRNVVEFGSGVSSIRLALALPGTRIASIESDPGFFNRVVEMSRRQGVDGSLTITLRRLRWQRHAGAFFLSYAPGPFPDIVDAVLIDGPPRWTRRGREACLYQVAPNLRIGAKVYLDDFSRPGERKILKNWMVAYPESFRVSFMESGHGVCVLEKLQSTDEPHASVRTLADHFLQAVRLLISHPLKSVLGSRISDLPLTTDPSPRRGEGAG